MHDTVEKTEQGSRQRLDLLIRKLRQRKEAERPRRAGIPRRPPGSPAPLSFAQERLWLIDQLEPGNPAYNVPGSVRLRGELDGAALAAALRAVVGRHEVLRTTFVQEGDRPVQRIAARLPLPLPAVDLRSLPPPRRHRTSAALARDAARRPFDLARGPLLRVQLQRLAADEHLLVVVLHHIVADGWSIGVLAQELTTAYDAARGGAAPSAEPGLQYADFAAWQRRELSGDKRAELVDYWRRALADLPALELPTDRLRPARRRGRGGSVPLRLEPALAGRLDALAARLKATRFMVLLAAFQTLLARYSGQRDFAVGTPVAGRERPEVEPLIGCFVNTLVMRARLAGDPSFEELVGRTREAALEAFAHQGLPFEQLVAELQPARDATTTPFFQVALALQNAPAPRLRLPGLEAEVSAVDNGTAKFDLLLDLAPDGDGLSGRLEYDADLFDRATVRRLGRHFTVLLDGLLDDPAQRVARLPLLTAAERHQLLRDWNPPAAGAPPAGNLYQRFLDQVRRRPEAPAISAGEVVLSYRQLAAQAARLAALLRRRGVGPETPVALFFDRDPELVIAILGVLQAGGAYVPLDPVYPAERLAFVLDDAGAPLLLTRRSLADRLPATAAAVICLDEQDLDGDGEPSPAAPEVGPDHLAYVIYTSGSTGRPKGVGVSHGNVLRLLDATDDWFGFGPHDVWTLFHSYAFDFSVWELWGALAYGGRLEVVSYATSRDPHAFRRLLAEAGVTVLNQTPSAFRQLIHADGEGDYDAAGLALRLVIFGGEALELQTLAPWYARHGDGDGGRGPRLINMYGITETTVHVTYRPLRAADLETAAGSVIGRPIPDLSVHLLDGELQPVPIGVPGELFVGGRGLARGYLGRPALTAQRFLPDPFAEAAGARLYRAGDLARRRWDGELVYLGRLDHQVQIRGFRVELGEIEDALARHPAVREAVVLARGDERATARAAGDLRLVAYVVAEDGAEPTLGELRPFLAQRLPDYMLPQALVVLDALPLTANGKIDRARLPAPAAERPQLDAGYSPPQTPQEALLADVWQRVLEVPRVGRDDDFFELGGHSLLATQVIARLRRELGVELPLQALFEAPTVAALAARLPAAARTGAPPLERDPGAPPAASFAQERLWFIDQLDPGRPTYHIAAGLRLSGSLDAGHLRTALSIIAARHDALRTTFAARDGRPQPVIARHLVLRLPLLDLRSLPAGRRERALRRAAAAIARRPFDLARGPLLRLLLVRLAEDRHAVVLCLHHIAGDGWSLGVLVRELGAAYRALVAGRPAELPPQPVQYQDFARWQRAVLAGPALDGRLAYWRQTLDGVPALALPTDRPRPALRRERGATASFALTPQLVTAVEARARRQGATPFMVLAAAFAAFLGRLAGQTDVALGTPIAGRERLEVENLIGFFVNTLVLRLDVAGRPSFSRLVERARRRSLEAYAHQDVPFEKLVEVLQPARDPATPPLFQVFLALQNAPFGRLELPGLELEPMAVDAGAARVDLSLMLTPHHGGLEAVFEYDRDLFDATTIRRFSAQLRTLLAAALSEPESPVDALPLLAPAERQQLLYEWNDTASEAPPPVLAQVLEQAAQRPQAAAVRWPGGELSYGELLHCAGRLKARLEAAGIGAEESVALVLDRSPELVVAALAVLLAGGAYVPLDPQNPAARLAFMIEDAGCRLILTRTALRSRLPQPPPARVLEVDLDDGAQASPPSGRRRSDRPADGVRADPQRLAYVIYTSGSTGRPKGVALSHGGLANLVAWHRRAYGVGPQDRASLVAGTGFDASVWEIWPYLAAGASLSVPPPAAAASAPELVAWLQSEGITLAFLPTPLAEAVLAEPGLDGLSLRALLTGGDRLRRRPPAGLGWRLINHYGPTEATVVTSAAPVAAGGDALPAIGRPIGNFATYVVDRELAPQPIGVPGELYVGGRGLARGYLGRPARTAASFVPDPFSGEPGARLYRTGDRVRWLAGGELAFLERLDQQVKIRGLRIELGEIETALAAHPGIEQAAVLARPSPAGGNRLVAYLAAAEEAPPEDGELRDFLAARLPAYMVPSLFVRLPRLPLTASGKIDRSALPEPDWQAAAETASEPPRDADESRVAGLFTELLGIDDPGREADFFALGGHSLLATQLVSRLRRATGVELPLHRLFERSTVAGIAAELRRLHPAPGATAAEPAAATAEPVLSFAQERMWFLDRLDPGSAAYNVPFAATLRGPLRPAALWRALALVVARHDVLRSRFEDRGGVPRPVIARRLAPALPVVDLSALPAPARRAASDRLAAREARRPFALDRGPLLRLALLRHGATRHLLLLNLHHIVADGWSIGVLMRELSAAYGDLAAGRPAALPALERQYQDLAAEQRRRLQGEELERQLAYWRRQLAGLPVLELPTDRPRAARQRLRGALVEIGLDPGLRRALEELARDEQGTLFMVLLAAFASLLGRYAGQRDLAVGSPIAGRQELASEQLIGLFVNTLVLRLDATGEPTFRRLVQRVRRTTLEAYAHQQMPFEKLVEALVPSRDLAVPPLIQVLFTLQNAPGVPATAGELELSLEPLATGSAKLDLHLALAAAPDGGLRGVLEYDRDLFDRSTIERLGRHFLALLEAAVRDPDRDAWRLPISDAAERHLLLAEWGGTAAIGPHQTLHRLVAAQAARTPRATAVVAGDETLDYRRLEARANRLAHHLQGLGVGPETTVGICLDRDLELVVAILAVLKAGGAYVALDPRYPARRLALILEDAAAPVVISRGPLAAVLPPDHGAVLVDLDGDRPAIDAAPATAPASAAGPDNLAYLIYTSGSTGRPKGVAIAHRSAAALVRWAWRAFPPADLAGVLAATSINFDLSVFELFVPLAGGGTVILADDALALAELPARQRVTLVNTVPSAIAALCRVGGLPRGVRTVNLAGEPLHRSLVDRVYAQLRPGARVWNLYGPSEDTTYSTAAVVPLRGGEPTIGRPLPGTTARVLDRALQPVPIGVAGELYLSGAGLARGYLGRPALTAERWLPDPYGDAGQRAYRTGDLVRWRADGELLFLGRADHQVKVRGYRIELGEIETALTARPEVEEAAVAVDRSRPDEARLVAFFTSRRRDDPRLGQRLGDALAEELPAYMVPSVLERLDELPRLPNGKVDRKALGELAARAAGTSRAAYRAPRGEVEERLAALWAELLGHRRIGRDDDFFALGGHSLLATRLAARLSQELGVELPLRLLFERPTLAALAAAVGELRRRQAGGPPPLVRRRDGERSPLSFAQERLWFLDQLEPGNAAYNLPLAVRLDGRLELAALAGALGEVIRRHETLRTVFARDDDGVWQVVRRPPAVPLAVVDLSALSPAARDAALDAQLAAMAERPFDLARGPLLRAALLRLERRRHALLLNLHHAISDGWSNALLIDELGTGYAARVAGRRPQLPELPVQYADFARWQRDWLEGPALDAQLSYWRRQLAGLPALELPADRPRPAVASTRGAHLPVALSSGLSEALDGIAQGQRATLFMGLLAAFSSLLGRYAGLDDVPVGTPVAGRRHAAVERLIGFFVNALVMRVDLARDPTFRQLLARVREVAVEAFAHQDVPFEKLVAELHPQRDLSRSPLFQVMLVLNEVPAPGDLPGLAVRELASRSRTAKFDLTLILNRRAGGLAGALEYRRDLFEEATMARLWRHFENLLRGIVADPDRRLSEISILDPEERSTLLGPWARPARPVREAFDLVQRLRQRAADAPDRPAVICGGETLSYGELTRRARRLARRLRELEP